MNHITNTVLANFDPDVVVWWTAWETDDLEVGDHTVVFGTPEHTQVLLDRMEHLYQRIQAPGRKLVILTMPVRSAGAGGTFRGSDAKGDLRVLRLNQVFRDFAARHPADVSIIDLAHQVCPHDIPCSATRDGIRPRGFDGVHFSAQGSAWAAHWLWPKLLADWPVANVR